MLGDAHLLAGECPAKRYSGDDSPSSTVGNPTDSNQLAHWAHLYVVNPRPKGGTHANGRPLAFPPATSDVGSGISGPQAA
jgi:hypothetical protein